MNNKRTIKILKILINEEKSIADLAEEFEVTERTIRNDLSALNLLLTEYGFSQITIDPFGKIKSELNPIQVNSFLSSIDFSNYKFTKQERLNIISYILASSVKPVTISQIADFLVVSRSTINKDIESLKPKLKQANLTLQPYSNKGLIIQGTEEDIRKLLFSLIRRQNLTPNQEIFDRVDEAFNNEVNSFSSYERSILEKIIREKLEFFHLTIKDSSLADLRNYIEIVIKRNRNHNFLSNKIEVSNSLSILTDELFNLIDLYFKTGQNQTEKNYLDQFIKTLAIRSDNKFNENLVEIQLITRKFIRDISDYVDFNLNDDYEFYESLSSHLTSIQNDDGLFNESNPFVEEIVKENPVILEAVENNIEEIERFFQRKLSQIDIAYIVVHICAALERKQSKQFEINTILICNAGIGTSKLIENRLKKHFNLKHIQLLNPQSEITHDNNTLIVSTVDLNNPDLNYIKVKPILTDEDYIRIGKAIESINKTNLIPKNNENFQDSVNELIKSINSIALSENLSKYEKLNSIDNTVLSFLGYSEAQKPRLFEFLTPDVIKLDIEAKNWKEAVTFAGEILLNKGIIQESYIDSCIEMIEKLGPYMLLGDNFLLPHSKVEKGNKEVGFSLVRFKNRIKLDQNRSFKFICFMSAVDESKHLRALFTLGNIIQNKEYLKKIEEAKTEKEVYEIIRKYDFIKLPVNEF